MPWGPTSRWCMRTTFLSTWTLQRGWPSSNARSRGRQASLVVIDSVMSFVGARTDVYRANEVRAVLAPLAKLADRFRCVVVAVRHITKSKGGRAIYAGQGSIDFTATARSVLLAGSSAQDPGEHALLHIKSVLGPAIG